MADSADPDSQVHAPPQRPAVRGHPLGPLVRRVAPARKLRLRLLAAATCCGCVAVLAVARWLEPAGKGVGTHEQLGLPPCSLVRVAGIPCPTCGMTTAFAHAVRGHLRDAFLTQPFAFALAVATLILALLAVTVVVTGRTWQVNWYRLTPGRVSGAVLILFGLSWIYKIISYLAWT